MHRIIICILGLCALGAGLSAQPDRLRFTNFAARSALGSSNVNDLARDSTGYLWVGTDAGVRRFDGYRFRAYRSTAGDTTGLRDNAVTCVLVDDRNRKWFGTLEGGIARLDEDRGTFVTYRAGLRSVRDLTQTSDGRLCAATATGLFVYDEVGDRWATRPADLGWVLPDTYRTEQHFPELPTTVRADLDRWARLIFPDTTYARRRLTAALGPAANGLWPLLRAHLVRETPQEGMGPAYGNLTALTPGPDGSLFLGYYHGGVSRWSAGAERPTVLTANVNPARSERMRQIRDLLVVRDTLLVAPLDGGVRGIDLQTLNVSAQPFRLPPTAALRLAHHDGRVYLATNMGVLVRDLDRGTVVSYDASGQYEYGQVAAETAVVLPTDDGTLWVGHAKHGLSYGVPPPPLRTHPRPGEAVLPYYMRGVTTALQDRSGRFWLGYYEGGIRRVDPSTFATRQTYLHDHHNGIARSSLFTIFEDRAGTLWAGGYRSGLIRYDMAADDWFPLTPGRPGALGSPDVRAIAQDSAGYLWVALHAYGVVRYDPASGAVLPFTPANGDLACSYPFKLIVDAHDRVWVATVNGLFRIETDRRTVTAVVPPADPDRPGYHHRINEVVAFGGGVAVGTQEGLLLFDQPGPDAYDMPPRLREQPVHAMVADPTAPGLWLTTAHDLHYYEPKRALVLRFGLPDDHPAASFTSRSGLATNDGRVAFGTTTGLVAFDPLELRRPTALAHPVITETTYFGGARTQVRGEDEKQGLRLTADNAGFELAFSVFDYRSPGATRYEVRLLPHQREWSSLPAADPRYVVHHLSPGKYRLEYRARNEHGLAAGTSGRLGVVVAYPWYATYWAFAAYLLLISALLSWYLRGVRAREALRQSVRFERREAERTRELAAEKSRFFENVSHDLRTPLTLIDTPLAALRRQPELPAADRRRYYDIMQRNSERLTRLITHLLDFQKLDQGALVEQTATRDVVALLARIAEPFALRAGERDITLNLNLPERPYVATFATEGLHRIVENLLSNAIKFTPPSGRVGLVATVSSGPAPELVVTVSDSGPGVPPGERQAVFERFYRNPAHRSVPGSGVGLAVVRELTERLGGRIACLANPGGGAAFRFQLPLLPAHRSEEVVPHGAVGPSAAPISPPVATPSGGPRPHLLIVDDDADIRATIRCGAGDRYRITEAADGRQGLDLARELQPDLIISDLMMPYLTGTQLCRHLKADPATSHLPLLLLTARHGDDARREGLAAGANAYLTKPFKLHLLFQRVDNTLATLAAARRRWLRRPTAEPPAALALTPADQTFLDRLRAFVAEALPEGTVDQRRLFRHLAVSRTVCFTKVKALTGLTLGEFIKQLRIDRARVLLRSPDRTTAEVAFAVGFKTAAHFSRTFRSVTGQTPSAYRTSSLTDTPVGPDPVD